MCTRFLFHTLLTWSHTCEYILKSVKLKNVLTRDVWGRNHVQLAFPFLPSWFWLEGSLEVWSLEHGKKGAQTHDMATMLVMDMSHSQCKVKKKRTVGIALLKEKNCFIGKSVNWRVGPSHHSNEIITVSDTSGTWRFS